MPVATATMMAACVTNRGPSGNTTTSTSDSRVKMSKDVRQWIETLTPPRSPSAETAEALTQAEPIIDDLWELWAGAGLHDLAQGSECTIDNALSELGFTTDEDAEEILDHLFKFVNNDSPPPTNPPSPPGPGDFETDQLIGQSFHHNYLNNENPNTSSICSSSSSTSGGAGENYEQLDDPMSEPNSQQNSPFYDEGMIGEDLINEQPNIFDSNFNFLDPKFNIFDEDFGKDLKHDCMWNGGCCSDSNSLGLKVKQDSDTSQIYSTSPKLEPMKFDFPKKVKTERDDSIDIKDETIRSDAQDEMSWCNDPFNMFNEAQNSDDCPGSPPDDNPECFKDLDWTEAIDEKRPVKKLKSVELDMEEIELRRHAAINDHSYANLSMQETKYTKPEPHKGIQAIVLPEENGDDYSGVGPKKTKILVPLKDLMDSLQHKTFLVAPLGPGKKVIRLTGSETVKGMLGVHHQALKSVSSFCVPQQSLYNRSSQLANSLPTQSRPSKKAKINKTIIREGGTITFPNQFSPSSPTSSSSSSISSSSTTASGKPKKTKTHNNMERMRRIDLRNSFDSLKKLVPPLSKSTKCSKVEILKRAEEYIRALKSLEKRLIREEAAVRARNEQLKSKLLH